jgi:hypothetical protein
MANGTTFSTFEASLANAELDSNPKTIQTGVKSPRHDAQPLFIQ